MPCNEADAVRLARLKGKKMAIKIKKAYKKNVPFIVLEKIMQIAENEIIMDTSPFFYE
jgi:hypothetical protein